MTSVLANSYRPRPRLGPAQQQLLAAWSIDPISLWYSIQKSGPLTLTFTYDLEIPTMQQCQQSLRKDSFRLSRLYRNIFHTNTFEAIPRR